MIRTIVGLFCCVALALEHRAIDLGLFVECQRIGARGGGHTPKTERASANSELRARPNGGDCAAEPFGDGFGRFLTCGDDGLAVG